MKASSSRTLLKSFQPKRLPKTRPPRAGVPGRNQKAGLWSSTLRCSPTVSANPRSAFAPEQGGLAGPSGQGQGRAVGAQLPSQHSRRTGERPFNNAASRPFGTGPSALAGGGASALNSHPCSPALFLSSALLIRSLCLGFSHTNNQTVALSHPLSPYPLFHRPRSATLQTLGGGRCTFVSVEVDVPRFLKKPPGTWHRREAGFACHQHRHFAFALDSADTLRTTSKTSSAVLSSLVFLFTQDYLLCIGQCSHFHTTATREQAFVENSSHYWRLKQKCLLKVWEDQVLQPLMCPQAKCSRTGRADSRSCC